MPITSIQRDQNNNVSLVRIISTDSLAAIDGTDYIAQQQDNINALNGGVWQWFISDMLLIAADDGNAFFEFIDDTFSSLVIFGSIGSGIINPGMTNQLPYYSTNGRVLSPLTNMADAILATNGSMVPGLTQTLPTAVQTNITSLGTIATGVWQGTRIAVPFGGTDKTSFTAYAVICGGTTSTGALQSVASVGALGEILTSNGPGALPTFQASPGSGTVSPGLANQIAYYASNGSTVSGLTSLASGVLITSGLGVPSISQTLPAAVQGNITALGTIATGVWNGTVIGGQFGGTGVNNGTSTITIGGNVTFSGAFTFAATLTGNTAVTFPTSGTLATTSQIPTGAALTKTDDTNVTLTLGGSPSTALVNAASLTLGWTGTLSGTRGGTGVNNGSNTATFAGNLNFANSFTTNGNFAVTQTYTGITNVTFPTSGTLATTAQIPTGAALTKTDDTNVTLTLGGSPSTALVNAASLTLGWTGQLGLTRGGTNASLTASNGGIVYSTSTALAILAGTATANQVLLSGSSAAPAWSTATYPATTTINQILYSSAANTITGIASVNSAVLSTNGSGVPSFSTTLPSGLAATNLTLTTPVLGTPQSGDLQNVGARGSVTLTFTGVSGTSTGTGYYVKVGKQCFISFEATGDFTSNATSFGITGLPFTAGTTAAGVQFIPVTRARNNSAEVFGTVWAVVSDAGTAMTFFLSGNDNGWTNSGGKLVNFRGYYWTT
jgi:hypothetical protein